MLIDFGLAQSEFSLHTKPSRTIPKIETSENKPSSNAPETPKSSKKRKQDKFLRPSVVEPTRTSTSRKRPKSLPSNSNNGSILEFASNENKMLQERKITVLPPVPRAGTRGFRAPEVLLRCSGQTTSIDIWSAGIILLSILTGRYPIFKPEDDFDAIYEIAKCVGTQYFCVCAKQMFRKVEFPEEFPHSTWKEAVLRYRNPNDTREWSDDCYFLLQRCLDLLPNSRITATEALDLDFFKSK
jgi:cell division control protein 7